MNSSNPTSPSAPTSAPLAAQFVLPKLKPNFEVQPGQTGEWNAQPFKAFDEVAASLDLNRQGAENVTAIPSIWARALLMEAALHKTDYPGRVKLVEQWRGMLAAFGLAELRSFDIKAELLQLDALQRDFTLVRSLVKLLPAEDLKLYSLAGGKNPWQEIYIFLWKGKPVGLSSPSTLVCPSAEGEWTDLPWYINQQLTSPIAHLNGHEKAQLCRWLEHLGQEVQAQKHQGNAGAINTLAGLLKEFQDDLSITPDQELQLSEHPQFFGAMLNRGSLAGLNKPIKAQPKPSSLQLVISPSKVGVKPPIIIPDPAQITTTWNEQPQNIWVHESVNLASLDLNGLRQGNLIWDVVWIESKDLFLPDFFFIERENALPGALMPKGTPLLTYHGQRITPILPLNPWLLHYFTPEDLIAKVQLEAAETPAGKQVRVILDLPLSGMNNQPSNYRISKDYLIKDENCIQEVPILEVWPNFQAPGWQEYYAFYYDGDYGEDTFQVNFAEIKDQHSFKEGIGNYSLVQLSQYPTFVSCQSIAHVFQGLIVLATPPQVGKTNQSDWTIGVDFGTSFSNVYINRNQSVVERLSIPALQLKVTDSSEQARRPVLYEYFMSPGELGLPMASVLTTRQASGDRPVLDARTYIPRSSKEFNPQSDWIRTNLKWSTENLGYNELFIRHLALQTSAWAINNNVRELQWSLSFPSAFSRSDITRYVRIWQNVTEDLEATTGVKHLCPDARNTEHFRSESLAIAQYFADFERCNLVNTTCIDMGGGTSDISIWQENNLIYQCSLQLAGRDLLSQFLELNPGFLRRHKLEEGAWPEVKGMKFFAKLDVLLRERSEDWLRKTRDQVADQAEVQGLTQLMALGIAGIYYYVGILLKVLHETGMDEGSRKYTLAEITPVYMGGNGSRLLHWLAEGGRFDSSCQIDEVFSRIMSCSSGFEDTQESTQLSQNPKDEVACGLVLSESKLKGLNRRFQDPLIAGEACLFKGQHIGWDTVLPEAEVKESISEFKVANLEQLQKFVYEFHQTLKILRIDTVTTLEGYKLSLDPNDNSKMWRETEKELIASLLRMRGNADDVRLEPPFILGLKALLKYLGREWANKWKG